jgi:ribosomal protein L32E
LIIIDIDRVFSKERTKFSSLLTLGSCLEKGFKVVNQTDEIFYGSSSVVSTFDPSGLETLFKNSIEIEPLKEIVENRWIEPAPKVSYADA